MGRGGAIAGVQSDPPRFRVETASGPGAVALIRLTRLDRAWDVGVVGFQPPDVGGLGLRHVFGIDHALIARPDAGTLLVMPHGGSAVVRAIVGALIDKGCEPVEASGAQRAALVERAEDASIERGMLEALAIAASPLAVDLLLDQPRRWAGVGPSSRAGCDVADGAVLGRLINPPTVVAMGRPNIGKSSLLNALAGRSLALAFDQAGTTRDAVGALIDAGGLVVRWIDTPGLPEAWQRGDALADEHDLVRRAAMDADLVVCCSDAGGEALDASVWLPSGRDVPVLHVVTRADRLGGAEEAGSRALRTSATSGSGLSEFVSAVREALLPASVYRDPRPWRFWRP